MHYDILIVGGGLAGCAAALTLARLGITRFSLLSDRQLPYQQSLAGESIPPDTYILLKQLNLWPLFLEQQHLPCLGSCSLWGSSTPHYNDFLFNPYGHGWHLNRTSFEQLLINQCQQLLDVKTGCKVLTITQGEHHQVTIEHNHQQQQLTANFLIDATGSQAFVAKALGAKREVVDLLNFALAWFATEQRPKKAQLMTQLEAVPYGWWYGAQLPQKHYVVSVASSPKLFKQQQLSTSEQFLSYLSQTQLIHSFLPAHAELTKEVIVKPVVSSRMQPFMGKNWLAIGDAAMTFDPLTARGIYKALQQGIMAAKSWINTQQGGEGLQQFDHYLQQEWQEYIQQRQYFYNSEQRWPDQIFWQQRHTLEQ